MLKRLLTILQHIEFIAFLAFETLISGLNKAFKKNQNFPGIVSILTVIVIL